MEEESLQRVATVTQAYQKSTYCIEAANASQAELKQTAKDLKKGDAFAEVRKKREIKAKENPRMRESERE